MLILNPSQFYAVAEAWAALNNVSGTAPRINLPRDGKVPLIVITTDEGVVLVTERPMVDMPAKILEQYESQAEFDHTYMRWWDTEPGAMKGATT